MVEALARRLEVGVRLPGTRMITREIPIELADSSVDQVINYVIDGNLDGPDSRVARAIVRETKEGSAYTIYIAKDNEQKKIGRADPMTGLFEIDKTTQRPRYQPVEFTVSRPRVGGH